MSRELLESTKLQADIDGLDRQIKDLQNRRDGIKSELTIRQNRCQHAWGETKYTPIYHEGYEIPGDPPGTMGVDWRGPMWVPAESIPLWRRQCSKCGKVEETRNTKPGNPVPVF